eukprot:CAMPEP_0197336016 /NCGR_PEP_ID=MMETSP0892-20130614/34573_1 /TAXON_ID=44058 ORGANISM="Aureoumbra lagunensis, Strain CCMP1510" /NCGR_SAMPLE_ID=MMETSP0892 /ASSEMBLY_ACC=CAM_ASM_000538 /LENGTH=56 /DNA_ID=CAMNT_0042837819 /DNA_START=394 /DNA_END=560 /DNA_ORIENTATION=-
MWSNDYISTTPNILSAGNIVHFTNECADTGYFFRKRMKCVSYSPKKCWVVINLTRL